MIDKVSLEYFSESGSLSIDIQIRMQRIQFERCVLDAQVRLDLSIGCIADPDLIGLILQVDRLPWFDFLGLQLVKNTLVCLERHNHMHFRIIWHRSSNGRVQSLTRKAQVKIDKCKAGG